MCHWQLVEEVEKFDAKSEILNIEQGILNDEILSKTVCKGWQDRGK